MIKDDTMIQVRNRNNGATGYSLPEHNLWRNFGIGEVKKVPFSELKELQYQPGGEEVLKNYLVIEDADALEALSMVVEPEYKYTKEDIHNLLFKGSNDQLTDFLNFAPKGAIEICKQIAVEEELPDTAKRKLISDATGFSIDNAIYVNKALAEDTETKKEEPKKERLVPIEKAETKAPARKAEPYKVITK